MAPLCLGAMHGTWNLGEGRKVNLFIFLLKYRNFSGGSDSQESTCNAGYPSSIPGLKRSPEEGMAIHSSVLAWRIPWAEDPGGVQSIGSHRVRHD